MLSIMTPDVLDKAATCPKQSRAGKKFSLNAPSGAVAMTKCLLYMAPIALIGLMATEARAIPAAWSGGIARNIATATADA